MADEAGGGLTLLLCTTHRAWKAALAACAVSLDFWEPVTAAQRQWLATTGYRVVSCSRHSSLMMSMLSRSTLMLAHLDARCRVNRTL